jgi:hypothetical protein
MAASKRPPAKPPPLPKTGAAEAAAPPLTQERRLHAALAHFHRFDKYWLERLEETLVEKTDGSIDPEMRVLTVTLLKRAKDWNLLRGHPSFPKSFVGD